MKLAQAGFTLVELLIVITIIGILAGVILTSLNGARSEGVESKIRAELQMLTKRASLEESSLLTFDMVCGSNGVPQSPEVVNIITAIERFSPEVVVCNSSTGAYAASAAVSTAEYWCVDNLGNSRAIGAPLTTELVCP